MSTWVNGDGLFVKFGSAEGDTAMGGQILATGDINVTQFDIGYLDLQSATVAVLGAASGSTNGSYGVEIPKGARIKAVEVLVITAFTSSGTIGTATLVMGTKKADRTTELDENGLLTASFVGGVLDAAGERTYVTIGSTGVGAQVGTTLAEKGVICVAASLHGTHPYTAGKARVRIEWFYP